VGDHAAARDGVVLLGRDVLERQARGRQRRDVWVGARIGVDLALLDRLLGLRSGLADRQELDFLVRLQTGVAERGIDDRLLAAARLGDAERLALELLDGRDRRALLDDDRVDVLRRRTAREAQLRVLLEGDDLVGRGGAAEVVVARDQLLCDEAGAVGLLEGDVQPLVLVVAQLVGDDERGPVDRVRERQQQLDLLGATAPSVGRRRAVRRLVVASASEDAGPEYERGGDAQRTRFTRAKPASHAPSPSPSGSSTSVMPLEVVQLCAM